MSTHLTSSASDIPRHSWIDRWLPTRLRPYARLARIDRPIGTWLLLLPCWWGLALASTGSPDLRLLGLFAIGALVMRGAGCTFNDIVDRRIDRQVARTAERPLASGALSLASALVFMALLCMVGLSILLQFNQFAVALGLMSVAIVAVYPFAKRVTYWPQAVLGLAFNWGALLGWAAVESSLASPALCLYVAGIFWTLGYDTIYAHQDREDDLVVGVKSTALKFGVRTPSWLTGFFVGALVFWAVAGITAGLGWLYYLGLVLVALHFAWQVRTLDIDEPYNCLVRFKANRDAGLIVFLAIVVDRVFT